MSAVCETTSVDELDGLPVGAYPAGSELPGGVLAWERLGTGRRCETWLAWSTELWCPVVVKFPRPHQLGHPRARQTLQREVAALAGGVHPGLPHVVADGTDGAMPYVVFEHVDGPTLDAEVDGNGAFKPTDVAVLGASLLAAVRTVHRRGIAHVDIKTENVVLRAGRPVLIDFGSARPLGASQPVGHPVGSPGYASPDLEAGEPISAAMDVYGVGATLHELLAGEPAFDPEIDAADRPPRPALPASPVAALIDAMLSADPARRPSVDTALHTMGRLCVHGGREPWPAWAELMPH